MVIVRNFNLYYELLQLIGEWDPALNDQPPATYAAACRWRPRGKGRWLEVWNHALTPGRPIRPVPPLNEQHQCPKTTCLTI